MAYLVACQMEPKLFGSDNFCWIWIALDVLLHISSSSALPLWEENYEIGRNPYPIEKIMILYVNLKCFFHLLYYFHIQGCQANVGGCQPLCFFQNIMLSVSFTHLEKQTKKADMVINYLVNQSEVWINWQKSR